MTNIIDAPGDCKPDAGDVKKIWSWRGLFGIPTKSGDISEKPTPPPAPGEKLYKITIVFSQHHNIEINNLTEQESIEFMNENISCKERRFYYKNYWINCDQIQFAWAQEQNV